MKKVLIITYYWPPSGGAGVQRWVKFVKYLHRQHIEPIVLTVHPDYATYPQTDQTLEADIPAGIKVFYAKTFELYSLYKKISSNKEVPFGGFSNTKKLDLKEKIIRFIRGNFIIPDPRRGWNRFAIAKAKALVKEFDIPVVITSSPPHSTQLVGRKLKQQLNVNWIADLRDPWTDIYYFRQMYPTAIATAIHRNLERKVLEKADKIITVSPALKRLFSEKSKDIANKIEIIPNGFDHEDFQHNNQQSNGQDDQFIITYTGTISSEYNLSGLFKALKNLPGGIKSKTVLQIIGQMPEEIITQFKDHGLDNMLRLKGYVPHSVAIQNMLASDVLLLVIPEVKNNQGILTGKLFEYLASQKPILLIGPPNGDAAAIVGETNSGIICDYNEHSKILNSFLKWYDGKSSDQPMIPSDGSNKYSRENLTGLLVKIIDSLA